MKYVFSTLSCDQNYTLYHTSPAGLSVAQNTVKIKGGHGVFDAKRFITPLGVMTAIKDEELDILRKIPEFLLHEKNGFIVVQDKSSDPEKVASKMELEDGSAPATPSKYQKKGKTEPTVEIE